MANSFSLSIAGINFDVLSRLPIEYRRDGDAYLPFLDTPKRDHDLRVSVEITDQPLRVPASAVQVFSADESWALFADGNVRYLKCPSLTEPPFWVAEITSDWSRIVVHVGPAIVQDREGVKSVTNPFRYPLDQIVMTNILARIHGAIFHCCGATLAGKGFLFLARSGGGKTTLANLLAADGRLGVTSDDRMIVINKGGIFSAFGTPWPGVGGMALNTESRLKGIFLLEKGRSNAVVPLTPALAVERMLPMTCVPWYDADGVGPVLDLCAILAEKVPVYEFCFSPDAGAAEALVESCGRL